MTQGNADSQQKVIKVHVLNDEPETALCGGEHKGAGFTGLFSRLKLYCIRQLVRDALLRGCIPMGCRQNILVFDVRKHPLPRP